MSTETYGKFRFRHVKDVGSPGKVRTYVERGASSRSGHLIKKSDGRPPHICIKSGSKPSNMSEASRLAKGWARKHG
jgi:hypothetical protein